MEIRIDMYRTEYTTRTRILLIQFLQSSPSILIIDYQSHLTFTRPVSIPRSIPSLVPKVQIPIPLLVTVQLFTGDTSFTTPAQVKALHQTLFRMQTMVKLATNPVQLELQTEILSSAIIKKFLTELLAVRHLAHTFSRSELEKLLFTTTAADIAKSCA